MAQRSHEVNWLRLIELGSGRFGIGLTGLEALEVRQARRNSKDAVQEARCLMSGWTPHPQTRPRQGLCHTAVPPRLP